MCHLAGLFYVADIVDIVDIVDIDDIDDIVVIADIVDIVGRVGSPAASWPSLGDGLALPGGSKEGAGRYLLPSGPALLLPGASLVQPTGKLGSTIVFLSDWEMADWPVARMTC